MHWADISDANHGLSLLNDCKYGYDAKGNVLRLSLLRSPEWPDPHADEGRHEFTYSLYAHSGNWKDALTVRRGYELNYPLLPRQGERHAGSLPERHSFLELKAENVVLTAAKKAEDDGTVVFRFYEWAGKESDVVLRPDEGVVNAAETDLMERPVKSLAIENGGVTIHTKPFEIKTVRLGLKKVEAASGEARSKQ